MRLVTAPNPDDGTVRVDFTWGVEDTVRVTLSGIDGRPDLTSDYGNFSGGYWHGCMNGPCPTPWKPAEHPNWATLIAAFAGPNHEGAMGAVNGPTLHAVFGAIRDE